MFTNIWIWIMGSLSIAVLLARAHHLALSPFLQSIVSGYDHLVSMLFAPLAPSVATLAQLFNTIAGTGATLLPHWGHIFLLATLHMLPQSNAAYGVGGARGKVLWVLQAIGALLAGALIAAFAGSQPFLVEGNAGDWAVGIFLVAATVANFLNDPDPPEVDPEVERAREDEEERQRMLSLSVRAFLTAVLLAFLALGAAALMFGLIDRTAGETLLFYVLVPLFILRVLVGLLIGIWADADDTRDMFDQGVLIGLARVTLFLGAIALGEFATPGGRSLASYFILLVGGGVLFGLFYAGRLAVDRMFARTTYDPPQPAALGLMLLGGAGLVVADLVIATSR